MLNSGMDQEHPTGAWGNGQPMHVYDKHQNKTAILHRNFSFAFDGFSLSVQGCLTERERRAFDTMYTDLPGVLTESIAELDSLLELRSRMRADAAGVAGRTGKPPRRSGKPDLKGKWFTERGEQLLHKIETPISMAVWNQLLSSDGSFMRDEQLRSDFFICVMRQIWSSPSKRQVLDELLARFRVGRTGAISPDRMFPYFAYHQIAINSIIMSSNLQYHLSFLRIPQDAGYRFIVTDNPIIDLCEEQISAGAEETNRFLWVIAPTLAVIVTDRPGGKTRFVTEREATTYNTLLFRNANRYVMLDKDTDFLSGCC